MTTIAELEQWSPFAAYYDVRSQLKRHVYARSVAAFAAGDAARDAVRTVEALRERQRLIRTAFLKGLGGLPPSDSPLNARVTGCIEEPGLRIEKVIFESRPGVFVTANLYVPDNAPAPAAAVLFLCGHSYEGKGYPRYQCVCRHLAAAGLIVLAQDPLGQGERLGYYEPSLGAPTVPWGTTEHDHVGAQCLVLGDSLARYFLHDALRGMDYLGARPEVDPRRIGVTGNSGGGTQTCMLMMTDPRVAAAAPGTFLMNRETYMYAGGAQDAEQIWPGFTAAGLDHEDVLLAMAPRPVRVLAVQYDFFPIEGTRRSVARCQRFWSLLDREGGLDLVEDVSPHAYTDTLARAAAEFFSRHLLGQAVTPDSAAIQALPPEALWCTPTGQVRAWKPEARFVFDENQDRLRALAVHPVNSREQARAWLHEQVRGPRTPCDLNPRLMDLGQYQGIEVTAGLWWSQPGLFNHGYLLRRVADRGQPLPVTIALWPEGTNDVRRHWNWITLECEKSRAVLIFDPTGTGALQPMPLDNRAPQARYGVLHKLSDDLCFLGDSLAAIRVWDLLRLLEMLACWPGVVAATPLAVHAEGFMATYARLAATLEPRLAQMAFRDAAPPCAAWVAQRHYDDYETRTFVLPGLLRHAPHIDC
ncbi:MAG: prolyl oligopeptidase family serine peptidase [Candidatus Marinimicrobia bacterium]|nr:prolyl oligopeptidase family serine peptidase [Candidatus Neomarinimicrobiota bacterium]